VATLANHVRTAATKVAGLFPHLDFLRSKTTSCHEADDEMAWKAGNPKGASPVGQGIVRENYATCTYPQKTTGLETGKPQAWPVL
jgi:hypothetical protein